MINPIYLNVSGLVASAKKAGVAASNIANASTTGSLDNPQAGQPYSALDSVTQSVAGGGVVTTVVPRNPGFVPSFEPGSPFANSDGLVAAPNVNLDEELINLVSAEQTYKANAVALSRSKDMHDELMQALDKKV